MFSSSFTLDNFEYFLLILVRIASFVVVAPFFNNTNVPNMTKIGFSCLLSFIIYYTVPFPPFDYSGIIGFTFCVVKEVITGLLLGFSANLCFYIIAFAGTIIDMDIGISMATEFDPTMKMEISITGSLYNYFILLLLLLSGMYQYIIRAICDSYQLIPIGWPEFHYDFLLAAMIKYLTALIVIAFRIFLPVFAVIMVLNCILGIMVKVAPQMNMFSVGMQLKVMTGLAVIYLTIFLVPNIAEFIFTNMKEMIILFSEGLRPW